MHWTVQSEQGAAPVIQDFVLPLQKQDAHIIICKYIHAHLCIHTFVYMHIHLFFSDTHKNKQSQEKKQTTTQQSGLQSSHAEEN